ncbi:hypothetical protein [Nonomuraea sp. B1E8]|uniref:hypothetical protein n=1 Tax=unclassified Nonomuraea TaxID=2593643 RepID=UPI00325E6B2F
MVRDDIRDRLGVTGAVDLEHADAEPAGAADGVIRDQLVPGEAVGLRAGRVADGLAERAGPGARPWA